MAKNIFFLFKKLKYKLIIFVVAMITGITAYGCGATLVDEVKLCLAECRYNIFVANTEFAHINFTSGTREEPYVLNGVCNQSVEFGVLCVNFIVNVNDYKILPTYILTINGNDYDGSLIQNPFDLTYVTDINTIVPDDSSISLKITFETLFFETDMQCLSKDWKVNYLDVLNIGVKELKTQIKSMRTVDGINAEFFIKIITDNNLQINEHYWYFSVLGKKGENMALVIDATTGNILARK